VNQETFNKIKDNDQQNNLDQPNLNNQDQANDKFQKQEKQSQSKQEQPASKIERLLNEISKDTIVAQPNFGDSRFSSNKNIKQKLNPSQEDMFPEIPREPGPPPIVRGGVQPPPLNLGWWKDKGVFGMARETIERNIEDVAGKDADKVKAYLVEPIRANENNRINFNNTLREETKKIVVDEYKIKVESKDDKLVQDYGEKLITLDELKLKTKNWQNVEKAAEYFRMTYDQLIDLVNKKRAKFGYEPIPKREDYFRHFQEVSNMIQNFGSILRAEDLPTEINGITSLFKPGKPFSTAELARIGGRYEKSAIKGMDNYLDTISKQIFHIDSVQRVRALEKYIREEAANEPDHVKLSNFVANLTEYGNLIAGKKSAIDRPVEQYLGGRKVLAAAGWVQKRMAANMVGANISSALTNFIPFTQSLATTRKGAAVRGVIDGMTSSFKKDFRLINGEESKFLLRRFPNEKIVLSRWDKFEVVLGSLFRGIDQFTSTSVVAGKYFENLNQGMSSHEAMKIADDYAGRVMADRSFGQLPNIMNVKVTRFLTNFQTEVNNVYSFIKKDIPRFGKGKPWKIASSIVQFVILSYIFNEVYQKLTGRRPTFDPIYAGLTIAGLTPITEGKTEWERVKTAAGDIANNLPFIGGIAGGRLPIEATFPDFGKVEKGDIYGGFQGVGYYLLPKFGGGQLRKTVETAWALAHGGVVEGATGKEKFTIDTSDIGNVVKGLVLGKYATKEGQEYLLGDKLLGLSPEAKKQILELREANQTAKDKDQEMLNRYKEQALTAEKRLGVMTKLEDDFYNEFWADPNRTKEDKAKFKRMLLEIRGVREFTGDKYAKLLSGKNTDEQIIILYDIKKEMGDEFEDYGFKLLENGIITKQALGTVL
jgi:hypothetical protein